MDNVVIFTQATPLLSIILIIIALCLGIIFYLWSLQVLKRIELQIIKMKQNAEHLEYLSQYIYETSYFLLKDKKGIEKNDYDNIALDLPNKQDILDELEEIKKQIKNIKENSNIIKEEASQKKVNNSENLQKIYPNPGDDAHPHTLSPAEEERFGNISDLITTYLRELQEEKERVCAQDLVYTMPTNILWQILQT